MVIWFEGKLHIGGVLRSSSWHATSKPWRRRDLVDEMNSKW